MAKKKKIRVRIKVSNKKLNRIRKWKQAGHQIFSFTLVVFSMIAAYFLFWGLIIEPNIPTHIYGPGDYKEFIYLLFSLLFMAVSYLFILLIKYKPLDLQWWDNMKLLYQVRFDLEKYTALRQMGIHYRHRKKKTKRHNHRESHKSITQ